jgi:hypothetical protein
LDAVAAHRHSAVRIKHWAIGCHDGDVDKRGAGRHRIRGHGPQKSDHRYEWRFNTQEPKESLRAQLQMLLRRSRIGTKPAAVHICDKQRRIDRIREICQNRLQSIEAVPVEFTEQLVVHLPNYRQKVMKCATPFVREGQQHTALVARIGLLSQIASCPESVGLGSHVSSGDV